MVLSPKPPCLPQNLKPDPNSDGVFAPSLRCLQNLDKAQVDVLVLEDLESVGEALWLKNCLQFKLALNFLKEVVDIGSTRADRTAWERHPLSGPVRCEVLLPSSS